LSHLQLRICTKSSPSAPHVRTTPTPTVPTLYTIRARGGREVCRSLVSVIFGWIHWFDIGRERSGSVAKFVLRVLCVLYIPCTLCILCPLCIVYTLCVLCTLCILYSQHNLPTAYTIHVPSTDVCVFMLTVASPSVLYIVLFCFIIYFTVYSLFIVAVSHDFLHTLLYNFFLCNSFPGDRSVQLLVFLPRFMHNAIVGIETYLSINDICKCVFLVHTM
jgi:hypothetical protein